MDNIVEGLFGRFRRNKQTPSQVPQVETTEGRTVWDYSHFREYLLALTRGRDFFLPSTDYPQEIELGTEWHQALDQMRKDSQDGIERFALIGFKEDRRSLYLPTVLAQGMPDHVPSEVIRKEIELARQRSRMTGFVGNIHSHPRQLQKDIWGGLTNSGLKGAFSPADLYGMVVPRDPKTMMVVVEGVENVVAMKTKQSTDLGIESKLFSQDAFEKYWFEKYGFEYLGSVKEFGARRAKPIRPDANSWSINTGIATRHNLVLYRGKSGENLKRQYP